MPTSVSFMRSWLTNVSHCFFFRERFWLFVSFFFFGHCAECSSSTMVAPFLRHRDVADPSLYHVVAKKESCPSSRWLLTMRHTRETMTTELGRPYCRKRRQFTTTLQFGSQNYSFASSYENSSSKVSSGQGMGNIGENFGVELDESQK